MSYTQYAAGKQVLSFSNSNIEVTNGGSLNVTGVRYLSIQGQNRVGTNLNSALVPITLTPTSQVVIQLPEILPAEDWQYIIVSGSSSNDATTLTQLIKLEKSVFNDPVILTSPEIFKLTLSERTVTNAAALPIAPINGLIRFVSSLNYYYEYDEFSTRTVDGIDVLSASVGRWIRITSPNTYIANTTLPGGCDRDVRSPNLTVITPNYAVDGSEGEGVIFWLRNDFNESIPSGTRISCNIRLNEEDKSQLFSNLVVLELLGYVNLTTLELDATAAVGEMLYDPNKQIMTLIEDLPSGSAAILKVSPKFRPEYIGNAVSFNSKLSVYATFSPTTGVYSPGVFGNVIYDEYDKWKIVPDDGLAVRKLKGSGIVDRYELNALPEEIINGIASNTANQYIFLTSNGTSLVSAASTLNGAIKHAKVSSVDGIGAAISYGTVNLDNTKQLTVNVNYPTAIRSDYPDTTIAGLNKGIFNASTVVIYIKNGSDIYVSEQVITPNANSDIFTLDYSDFISSSLSIVDSYFGLYKPTLVTTNTVNNTSTFPTATYEVYVAFKYIDVITSIDHSESELVEVIANLAEILDTISTVWYTGSGAPDNETGINNDLYLNFSNGDIYKKINDIWTLEGNIKGNTGQGAYTLTTASYIQPAVNSNITVSVSNSQWMAIGQILYITNGGSYEVISLPTTTSVTLKNLGYSHNVSPTTTINDVQNVVSGGLIGNTGATGNTGQSAYTITTADYTQPNIGSNVTVSVSNSEWLSIGQTVFISTGGYYEVISLPDATSIELENLGYSDNAAPTTSIASGKTVSSGGIKGNTGNTGTAATISIGTVTTGAAGSSVSVTNSGTSNDAVLNFTIPQGNAGSVSAASSVNFTTLSSAPTTGSGICGLYFLTSGNTPTYREPNNGTIRTLATLNKAQQYSATQGINTVTLTDSTTITLNMLLSNKFRVTLGGNRTLSLTNIQDCTFTLRIYQDNTGSRTLTFPAAIKFSGGVTPSLTSTPGKFDLLTCECNGTDCACTLTPNF